jgi:hypothetical protein
MEFDPANTGQSRLVFHSTRVITMQTKISRRTLVKGALAAGAIIPAMGMINNASAAAMPALDPADPQAKALGYVADTTKVDAKANPTHKPEQKCVNCAQFQGKAGDASGGCNIFAGKAVSANGWCKVWAKKPGT